MKINYWTEVAESGKPWENREVDVDPFRSSKVTEAILKALPKQKAGIQYFKVAIEL